MIQGRDLFKVILAVAAILALVFAVLHFANSSGKNSSLSGDIPKLVISGTNSAGAVPALENFSSRINTTKKSGYTGTLATKYRARQPVDCLAGSKLSFAFPDGEPDKLRAYFSYYAKGVDKSDLLSEEYEALVYGDSITLPTQGLDFMVYPEAIYSYVDAGEPSVQFSSVVFYRLVATWNDEDFEYDFAVNLEGAEASEASVIGAGKPSEMPKFELSGINADGEEVSPECYVAPCADNNISKDYVFTLEQLYKSVSPVSLPAGSNISFSFPNGDPDDINVYYFFRSEISDYVDIVKIASTIDDPQELSQVGVKIHEFLITKEKQAVIAVNTIRLPSIPTDNLLSTVINNSEMTFFKLMATWQSNSYEYIFALSLT
ncbi:MAG: hypothetical protein AB9835_00460 [Eubacteriales bacterium]